MELPRLPFPDARTVVEHLRNALSIPVRGKTDRDNFDLGVRDECIRSAIREYERVNADLRAELDSAHEMIRRLERPVTPSRLPSPPPAPAFARPTLLPPKIKRAVCDDCFGSGAGGYGAGVCRTCNGSGEVAA